MPPASGASAHAVGGGPHAPPTSLPHGGAYEVAASSPDESEEPNPFEDEVVDQADQSHAPLTPVEPTLPVTDEEAYAHLQQATNGEINPFESDVATVDLSAVVPTSGDLGEEILPVCWRRESRSLVQLAMPAVVQNLLFVSMGTGSQMLIGHVSSDALAAAVCANLVFNVFFFFLFGFAGALDTLAAQSFGAGSMRGVQLWTKRALLLSTLIAIPIAMPIFFSYDIMRTILGQPEAIAVAAQSYCRWIVLGLWPFIMTTVLQKSLQAQGVMRPTILIGVVANVFNITLEALLIWPAGMGLQGGALGMSLARWIQFGATAYYMMWRAKDEERKLLDKMASEVALVDGAESAEVSEHAAIELEQSSNAYMPPTSRLTKLRHASSRLLQTGARSITRGVSSSASAIRSGAVASARGLVTGAKAAAGYARDPRALARDMTSLRKESMEGVWNKAAIMLFIKLGLSSGVMAGLEAWAFETTGIMATSLTQDELNAHYVLLNITLITYFTFPFGISIAASIRIGNLIGAGHVQTAQMTSKIVGALGAGFMSICGIGLASTSSVIGYLFSNDDAVVSQVARIAPIGGLFQLFDGVQGAVGGVLRGLGLQRTAACTNFLGLWVCGVTCAYLITFPGGVGLPGLWWGLAIGLFVTSILNCAALYRADWHAQVTEAKARIRADEEEHARRQAEIDAESAEVHMDDSAYEPTAELHHSSAVQEL